ncbi:cell wall-binding repeat-containing protein [Glaciibacter psychrotolerans]|uniref:Putative cell wall-binding protein n=1 Tax=Glaciibacter psychrotolerans TaxID=670054 RepID=A0A7Z0EEM5_9MICO|nr:cell wall-binding repeat-containing protein [Leifsonia psychrotolerans]NYJ20259.1 putative cell wall-binding protein [Leifsonia psychrotolerans]
MRSGALILVGTLLASVLSTAPAPAAQAAQDDPVVAAASSSAHQLLATLTVADPHEVGYNRDLFTHWVDADANGCDTRQEVLIAESTIPVTRGAGCSITAGSWYSWYDGATWTTPADVDVDHFVPLQEAWKSGAYSWNAAQRQAFANDLGLPESLVAVTDSVNSAKGGSDPSRWLPPLAGTHCDYAIDWVLVKYRWNLSIDPAEKATLDGLLAGSCGARAVAAPSKADTTKPLPSEPVTAGVVRIAGADRYATAIAISAKYPAGVDVVYLATGTNYPDALSAAPAAAKQGGPLLLTAPDSLVPTVRTEIQRLKPQLIVAVGGESAISTAVFSDLKKLAPTVRRDAGRDRYETSRIVTANAFTGGAGLSYLATGNNFPDALSASAAAGSTASPVILVNGANSSVDTATGSLIVSLKSTSIRIAGGTAVVSSAIEAGLKSVSGVKSVKRLAGNDRYATSVTINSTAFGSSSTSYLAVGTGFADALAGAALAGRDSAPLYVVPNNCVPDAALSAMTSAGSIRTVLLGGTGALGAGVAKMVPCSTIPAPAPPAPPKPPAPPVQGPTVDPSFVSPGAFCAAAKLGWIGYTKTGKKMVCSKTPTDSKPRWRAA